MHRKMLTAAYEKANKALTVDCGKATWIANDMGKHGPIVARSAIGAASVQWTGAGKVWETMVGLLKHDGPEGQVEISEYPLTFWSFNEDGEIEAEFPFPSDLKIELV